MGYRRLLPLLGLLLLAVPARATITPQQTVCNTGTSTGAISATISATTTGDLISAYGSTDNIAVTLALSDNQSNAYTAFSAGFTNVNLSAGNHAETDLASWSVDAHGGVTSVSVVVAGGVSRNYLICVSTYRSTNGFPGTPSDVSATQWQGAVSSFSSGVTATRTSASEALVGFNNFINATGSGTVTPTNSFTLGATSSVINGRNVSMSNRIVTSTGTDAYTGTSVNSTDVATAVLTFKDNAPSGPPGSKIAGPSRMAGPSKTD